MSTDQTRGAPSQSVRSAFSSLPPISRSRLGLPDQVGELEAEMAVIGRGLDHLFGDKGLAGRDLELGVIAPPLFRGRDRVLLGEALGRRGQLVELLAVELN